MDAAISGTAEPDFDEPGLGASVMGVGTGRFVGLPQRLGCTEYMIHPTTPDKQSVAQSVQVLNSFPGHFFGFGKLHQQPFGTTAHRAADVQFGIEPASTGQHKRPERLQVLVGRIDFSLELSNFNRSNARLVRLNIRRQSREYGAEIKELVLHPLQNDLESRQSRVLCAEFFGSDARYADKRVQLIHCPVALDAERMFRYTLATYQLSLARISCSCIDAIKCDARFVEGFVCHCLSSISV